MDDVSLHCFADEEAPARRLGAALGVPVRTVVTHRFPDGELAPRAPAGARTVIVYRSLDRPNEKLVELLLACDAWRRGGAARLVLVAPYLCYMRQDAVFAPGEPLSQRVIAGLLGGLFDRIVTVDAHLHRTAAITDLPGPAVWENLSAAPAIAEHLAARGLPPDLLVVGPDVESAGWTAALADLLGVAALTLEKTRHSDAAISLRAPASMDLAGRPVLLVDDICSSGGTLEAAVTLLRKHGAGNVDIVVTHALLADAVRLRLIKAGAGAVLSTDSCMHASNAINLSGVLSRALAQECGK